MIVIISLLLNYVMKFTGMAEDFDVEAMLEAPYRKGVSILLCFRSILLNTLIF